MFAVPPRLTSPSPSLPPLPSIIAHRYACREKNTGHSRFAVKLSPILWLTVWQHAHTTGLLFYSGLSSSQKINRIIITRRRRAGAHPVSTDPRKRASFFLSPLFPSNNPWEFEQHPLICSSRVPPTSSRHRHPSTSLALPPSPLLDVSRDGSHSLRCVFLILISVHFPAFINPSASSSLLSGKRCKNL